MLRDVGTWTLYLAAVLWTTAFLYHLTARQWWLYEVSRHLSLLFGSLAVLLDLIALRNLLGEFRHYTLARTVVFMLIPLGGALTLYLQVKWRRRGRMESVAEAAERRSQSL